MSPGLRYMAWGAFLFSVMGVLVKEAGQTLPTAMIILARSFIAAVLGYAAVRAAGLHPWGTNRRLLVLRGLFGFLALSCFFWSLTHLPLADAITITYTNPVWTALLAAVVLRERITAWHAGGTLFCLAGVLLIARPSFLFGADASTVPLLAAGVALAGAVLSSCSYVTVRLLRDTDHPYVIVFYFPLIATPLALPATIPVARWPDGREWLLLVAIGIVTQIAQVFMTRGLHLEPAGRAASVSYLQVVFAFVWGVLFFGETPVAFSLIGTALVFLGAMTISRGPDVVAWWRRRSPPPAEPAGPR